MSTSEDESRTGDPASAPLPPAGVAVSFSRGHRLTEWQFVGLVGAVVVAAALVAVVVLIAINPTQRHAKKTCEQAVRDQLVSPATATFSDLTMNHGPDSGGIHGTEYTLTGSVDSQNSFGAMLRSTFTCSVTKGDGSAGWYDPEVDIQDGGN